ncbi:hypothetical protein [Synechococcus sp. CS-1328]|uniref:hypothetical protein n=1 Tax=Synechococcus sp. CS-1328 TaxID=2847976 RepID=UPI00223B958D|nr:hypothetical protein [Synechococcus sp. CS-1328]MCT0226226.1 hypothetical protein [Synechococcus sp. CS-1328]
MARLMVVLKPVVACAAGELIPQLEPVLQALEAAVDERSATHLGGSFVQAPVGLKVQLFGDVQPRSDGYELELVLMSGEPMAGGSRNTRLALEGLLSEVETLSPGLKVVFRSDRDGPCRPR